MLRARVQKKSELNSLGYWCSESFVGDELAMWSWVGVHHLQRWLPTPGRVIMTPLDTPHTIKQSQRNGFFWTKKILQMSPLGYGANSVNSEIF